LSIENELSASLSGMDVVIVHNVASMHFNLPLTAALYRLAQSGSIPRLILWHYDLAWFTPRYQNELHDGYPWDLLRQPWEGAKQVAISEIRAQEVAELMHLPVADIPVIPAGLDLEEFLGLQPRTIHLLRDLHLSLAEPILLTPVRINRRRNLELAIQTMAELRREMPHAALIVTGPVGSNPSNLEYFELLQKLRASLKLEGTVHLLAEFITGGLPEAVLADFFRIADALFLPSREEGFGNPVLEAGLAGLPIFCSELPALRALSGGFATYFPPEASAKTVAWLIAKRLQSSAVYRLRAQLRREYTWESIYQRKLALLLEK
jgi:glycosyltransferase involved in cell wall biosynthesis